MHILGYVPLFLLPYQCIASGFLLRRVYLLGYIHSRVHVFLQDYKNVTIRVTDAHTRTSQLKSNPTLAKEIQDEIDNNNWYAF
jgi:hypothetical protein